MYSVYNDNVWDSTGWVIKQYEMVNFKLGGAKKTLLYGDQNYSQYSFLFYEPLYSYTESM